jgi:hypothetical protein
MPVFLDADLENRDKQQKRAEKVQQRSEQMKITEQAKGQQKQRLSEKTILKKLWKQPKAPKEPTVTMNDIKREMEFCRMMEEEKQNQITELVNDAEVGELKEVVMDVLAMPHTDPRRQKMFAHLLKNSNTVNSYVNDNVVFRLFNKANDHVKFGAVYATNYLKADQLVKQFDADVAAGRTVLAKPEAPKEEAPKEEVKEEAKEEAKEVSKEE